MKKLLSIVLALTLVLTTFAVPMAVSAADAPEFTVSYAVSATNADASVTRDTVYYPGDKVTVDVNVTASSEAAVSGLTLFVPWSAEGKTDVATEMHFSNADSGIVAGADYYKIYAADLDELDITFGSESVKIATISFTVASDAEAKTYAIEAIDVANIDDNQIALDANAGYDLCPVINEAASYTVAVHEVKAKVSSASISETEVTGTIATPTEVTSQSAEELEIALTSSTGGIISDAKLYYKDASNQWVENVDVVFTDGVAKITAFGSYKITCATQNSADYTFYFDYVTSTVADLKFAVKNAASGVQPSGTFDVEVKATSLNENVVEVVDFTVAPDEGITLTNAVAGGEGNTASFEGNIVTFATGTDNPGIAEGEVIVTLTFTVSADVKAVGTYEVDFTEQSLAINGWSGAATELSNYADTVAITVYSADVIELGEIAPGYAQEKTQTTAYEDGWSVKEGEASYKLIESTTDQATATAEELFAMEGTSLTIGDAITYEEEGTYYYIVAQFGTEGSYVYVTLQSVTPEDLGVDLSKPDVDLIDEFTKYVNNSTKPSIAFTVSDNYAEDSELKLYYKFDVESEYEEVPADVEYGRAKVALPTGVVLTKVYVKVTDTAENTFEDSFDIMYDDIVPVVTAEVGKLGDGSRPITVTLESEEGQSPLDLTISVLYRADNNAETAKEAPAENASFEVEAGTPYVYNATKAGFYTFVATDEAENSGESTEVEVKLDKQSIIRTPKFVINSKEDAAQGNLKTDDWLANAYAGTEVAPTNGTFAYLAMIPDANQAGGTAGEDDEWVTAYTLIGPDGAEVEDWDYTLDATTAAKGEYKLTVKTYMVQNEANDFQKESYTFSIYAYGDAEFKTVNADKSYGITDYMRLKFMTDGTGNRSEDDFNTYAQYFEGGYFSGDLDASLDGNYVADRAAFIEQFKTAKRWNELEFGITND